MAIRKLILFVLIFLGSCFAYSDENHPENVNANDLLESLLSQNADKVFLTNVKNESKWRIIIENISTGDFEWLKVGSELRKHSDAGSSEDLDMAFSIALSISPANVLKLIEYDKIAFVCGYMAYQIYDSNDYPTFLMTQLKSLDLVSEPTLSTKKYKCKTEIEKSINELGSNKK